MKSVLPLTLVYLLASMIPVWAQEPRPIGQPIAPEATRLTALHAESRFADARRITRKRGGRVEEAKGLLVSDSQAKEVRFEVGVQAAFAVPYDRITALHYEKAVGPSKWGWPLKETKYYLTIHYADTAGRATFETLGLSEGDVSLVLDALETGAGLKIDRTLAKQSFLGIPIRAAIGDRVTVTDQTGQNIEGTITELSAASLALDGSTAGRRVFDGLGVKRVRLTRSRGHDALRGLGVGALTGGILGGFVGRGLGGDARSAVQGAAFLGPIDGGIGALLWAVFPSYRFRATGDVYLGATTGASKTSAITIGPRVAKARKGVAVSVGF